MKKIRIALLTMMIASCACATVIYSSCSRDKCKGVSCQNGVTSCIDGTCQCPTGYAGNFCELSSITFRNDSYTPVYITVSGSSAIIPPDSTVTFTGQSGQNQTVYAYTYGTNAANQAIGDTITWGFSPNFPVNGATLIEPLDVSIQYFFLKIIDSNSVQSIVSIDVDSAITGMSANMVSIPNDKQVHGVGYYTTYPQTAISATGSAGKTWSWPYPLSIPDTVLNASLTITAE